MDQDAQLPEGVFSEGATSYLRGLPRENCPYPPGSDEREGWLAGWDETKRRADAGEKV